MFYSTSIPSVGLALSALLLSATATPLQASDAAFDVVCSDDGVPADVLAQIPHQMGLDAWCTSRAVSLVCSGPSGILGPDPEVPGAMTEPNCNEHCKCVPHVPTEVTPPTGPPTAATDPHPPKALTCAGTLSSDPATYPLSKTLTQDWCTSELVTTVCEGGKPVLYGLDQYDVCLKVCTC